MAKAKKKAEKGKKKALTEKKKQKILKTVYRRWHR